jgi:serine-type D-Ala-D-Ala carboxypeptidase/endopeptidase (penicillin-binding protein 4)
MNPTGPGRPLLRSGLLSTLPALVLLGFWISPAGAPPPDLAPEATPSDGLATYASAPAEAVSATSVSSTSDESVRALQNELTRLLGTGAGRQGQWGILATSASRADTLFARNGDASLAPASNQKLFTSAGALYHMGPDFRFATFLLARGEIRNGVLEGDLILYGTGDPSMADRLLDSAEEPFVRFAQELKSQGIHTVRGNILGDGTFFNGPSRRDSWNPRDLNDWFAAPISALSFNENLVTLRIQPGAGGGPPRVLTQPAEAVVPLENQGRTGGSGQALMVVRDDPDDPIQIRGVMRPGQADVWRRITVSDPPSFAASVLHRVLRDEGIRVTGTSRAVPNRDASVVTGRQMVAPAIIQDRPAGQDTWTVAIHHSPPLSQLLEVVNKRSHNLHADAILFALGRIARGDGSFDGGGQALSDYLTGVVGMPEEGLHIVDGSGLSRLNRARPSHFVQLLAHMDRDPHGHVFWTSLPEAGNQRELRRMYRSAAAGNLRAKTGTIHRVSALSGVVRSTEGEPIYFSIMANDVPSPWAAKQVEDRIGIQLASFSRPYPGAVEPDPADALPGEPTTVTAQEQQ